MQFRAPTYSGWHMVQGKKNKFKGGPLFIQVQGGELQWYKKTAKPQGSIDLRGMQTRDVPGEDGGRCFAVYFHDVVKKKQGATRRMVLAADSPETKQRWMTELNESSAAGPSGVGGGGAATAAAAASAAFSSSAAAAAAADAGVGAGAGVGASAYVGIGESGGAGGGAGDSKGDSKGDDGDDGEGKLGLGRILEDNSLLIPDTEALGTHTRLQHSGPLSDDQLMALQPFAGILLKTKSQEVASVPSVQLKGYSAETCPPVPTFGVVSNLDRSGRRKSGGVPTMGGDRKGWNSRLMCREGGRSLGYYKVRIKCAHSLD